MIKSDTRDGLVRKLWLTLTCITVTMLLATVPISNALGQAINSDDQTTLPIAEGEEELSDPLGQAINSDDPTTYAGKFWRVYSPKFGGQFVLYDKSWAQGVYLNNNCSENRCWWMLAPGSSVGYFYLLNYGSGNVMCVKDGAKDNKNSDGKTDWHVTYTPAEAVKHTTWCEWKLDPVDSRTYRISNLNSGKCVTVRDCKYAWLSHWDCKAACNQFTFSRASEIRLPQPAKADPNPPDIMRLNSFDDLRLLPEQGKAVLLGETLVPYIAVSDAGRTPQWQIKNSPYYIISRKQAYRVEQAEDIGEGMTEKLTITVTEGASTEASQTAEKTVSWKITAKASFDFKGFSAGLEREINKELKLTKSTSSTEYTERKIERELVMPTSRIAYAVWTLVNLYELRRSDGSVATTWEVYTDRHIVDTYPKEKLDVTFD